MSSSGMFGSKQGPVKTVNESEKTKTNNMTDTQRKYLNKALKLYGNQLGKNPVYSGDRVANTNTIQNKVFDFANNGGFMTTPEQTQSYFDSTIKNPMMKNLNEVVKPAVKEAYAGPGYWGSARAGAETKAVTDTADNLNTAWGNLNWDTLLANRQGAKDMYDVGSMKQTQAQNEINAKMTKFAEDHQLTDPESLNTLLALLGMNAVSTKSSSGEAQQYTTTPSWHMGDWLNFGANMLAG